MSKKKPILGYLVMERCEEWEQPLALERGASLPPGGLLVWANRASEPVALFETRALAMAAVVRTDHYRLAYQSLRHPEKRFCVVVPVEGAA